MKKAIKGFVKSCIAVVLLLVVVLVLLSVLSTLGVFIGVLLLFYFLLLSPVWLYRLLIK